MALAFRNGQMGQDTKDSGKMIKHMGKGRFIRSMVTYTKVSGNRIWSMDSVGTPMSTELSMKATGNMICNTDSAKKCGTTIHNTQGIIIKAKSMEKEYILGKMVPAIMVTGTKTEFMEWASIRGQMAESTMANGRITTWMAKAYTGGRTAESTKDSINVIKSTAMEYIPGPMADNTMDHGSMASNMAKVNTS